MGLSKLIANPDLNQWAQAKAAEVLASIPSQDLILDAYLFGSAVDGNFTSDSDLDLLVVVPDQAAIIKLQKEVYSPRFTDVAIDWILRTQESFETRKLEGGVCFVAAQSGMKLR